MIKYRLACENGHEFEGWFRSIASFDAQADGGHIACPRCGTSAVGRAIMAPGIVRETAEPRAKAPEPRDIPALLRRFRAEVEANAEYVGQRFADEARRIHDEEAPERSIYGEASIEQARALAEEGIPFLPLPPLPKDFN